MSGLEESISTPADVGTGGCELPDVDTENQTQFSARTAGALNHCATSPAPNSANSANLEMHA